MTPIIQAYNNYGNPLGITVVIAESSGQNFVEYQSAQMETWQETGIVVQGDATVQVGVPPLDLTTAYQIRVRSVAVSTSYSNTVFIAPTGPYPSEMLNILCGLQTFLMSLNFPEIGIKIHRAEDIEQFLPQVTRPAIMLQKAPEAEKRKTLDNFFTNWQWPIKLWVIDAVVSPTIREEIHDYWRESLFTNLDRLGLATYPKCKRIDVEPGNIQGTTVVGVTESNPNGFAVWVSEMKLWCETDLLIGRYRTAQSVQVQNGGAGYVPGQILTLAAGIVTKNYPTTLDVQYVDSNGGVTQAAIIRGGIYGTVEQPGSLAIAPNPIPTTGGTGTGATFNLTWGQ